MARDRAARREIEMITPFHGKLLALLARHGLFPKVGQTAREFADETAIELSRRGAASAADVPILIANAYYRTRFGGQLPSEVELRELDSALNQLADVLDTNLSGQAT
jgi:hypothetical protein